MAAQCLGANGDGPPEREGRCLGLSGRSPPGACPPASTTPCRRISPPSVAARAASSSRAHGADGDWAPCRIDPTTASIDAHLTPEAAFDLPARPWMDAIAFIERSAGQVARA